MSVSSEITRIQNGVTTQAGLISQIQSALIAKASGCVKVLASVPETKDASIIIVDGVYYLWRD